MPPDPGAALRGGRDAEGGRVRDADEDRDVKECAICLQPLRTRSLGPLQQPDLEEDSTALPCRDAHGCQSVFHAGCLRRCFAKEPRCPLCRREFAHLAPPASFRVRGAVEGAGWPGRNVLAAELRADLERLAMSQTRRDAPDTPVPAASSSQPNEDSSGHPTPVRQGPIGVGEGARRQRVASNLWLPARELRGVMEVRAAAGAGGLRSPLTRVLSQRTVTELLPRDGFSQLGGSHGSAAALAAQTWRVSEVGGHRGSSWDLEEDEGVDVEESDEVGAGGWNYPGRPVRSGSFSGSSSGSASVGLVVAARGPPPSWQDLVDRERLGTSGHSFPSRSLPEWASSSPPPPRPEGFCVSPGRAESLNRQRVLRWVAASEQSADFWRSQQEGRRALSGPRRRLERPAATTGSPSQDQLVLPMYTPMDRLDRSTRDALVANVSRFRATALARRY